MANSPNREDEEFIIKRVTGIPGDRILVSTYTLMRRYVAENEGAPTTNPARFLLRLHAGSDTCFAQPGDGSGSNSRIGD